MGAMSARAAPVPSLHALRYLRFSTEQITTPPGRLSRRRHFSALHNAAATHHHAPRMWTCTGSASQRRTIATSSPRLLPREVASRTSLSDKWHMRRPSTYRSSPDTPGGGSALTTFLDDSSPLTSSSRLSKATSDQRLRCTEFDEHGNVTLVSGEFKKSELIQKYGLQPRDLRKIDSSLLPTILVRPRAILLNLLHIRCLIQADRVLVFDAYGSTDSYTQSLFMYDLEGKLAQREGRGASTAGDGGGPLPYEFRALEAVLISVTAALEGEFEGVRGPVVKVLRELEENIDRDTLRLLLVLSKKLGGFEQRARLVRDAIDELLEADDDLASMYLTEKKEGKEREEDDHTEVEMLLESYDKVCDEIVQVSGNLVSNIRNTEEIVKAILDANRNSLMLLDLKFSIGTLGIGAGTFVAALYGMNLKSFIEEWDFGFPLVSMTCAVFTIVACVYGLRKLRKVQRLSMWGEGNGHEIVGGGAAGKKGGLFARLRGLQSRGPAVAGSRGAPEETGAARWSEVAPFAERVERMEKMQWRTEERLRQMRAKELEGGGAQRGVL